MGNGVSKLLAGNGPDLHAGHQHSRTRYLHAVWTASSGPVSEYHGDKQLVEVSGNFRVRSGLQCHGLEHGGQRTWLFGPEFSGGLRESKGTCDRSRMGGMRRQRRDAMRSEQPMLLLHSESSVRVQLWLRPHERLGNTEQHELQ